MHSWTPPPSQDFHKRGLDTLCPWQPGHPWKFNGALLLHPAFGPWQHTEYTTMWQHALFGWNWLDIVCFDDSKRQCRCFSSFQLELYTNLRIASKAFYHGTKVYALESLHILGLPSGVAQVPPWQYSPRCNMDRWGHGIGRNCVVVRKSKSFCFQVHACIHQTYFCLSKKEKHFSFTLVSCFSFQNIRVSGFSSHMRLCRSLAQGS